MLGFGEVMLFEHFLSRFTRLCVVGEGARWRSLALAGAWLG